MNRAIEPRDVQRFIPGGAVWEQAATVLRLAAEAIEDGDTRVGRIRIRRRRARPP
ncbi:MAG TPA: hypothetical protein VHN80_00950 [Kineosporiaceae bacterium]|nr:hypothetical protein [Kineosporiaceae bacterium]